MLTWLSRLTIVPAFGSWSMIWPRGTVSLVRPGNSLPRPSGILFARNCSTATCWVSPLKLGVTTAFGSRVGEATTLGVAPADADGLGDAVAAPLVPLAAATATVGVALVGVEGVPLA